MEMLSLELIGIIGVLFGLLTCGMAVTQFERRKARRAMREAEASEGVKSA
jgi:hypothetical protein